MEIDSAIKRLLQPELFLLLLTFAFNTTWEFVQDPLYAGLAALPHEQVRIACLKAASGDAAITLLAFYASALIARSRYWFMDQGRLAFLVWFAVGLLITVALERHATTTGRWAYVPAMPVIPGLGVGLAPLSQWIVIPAVLLFLLRTHCSWSVVSGQHKE